MLLIFVSGLPPAEKPTQKKYWLMSHGAEASSHSKWAEYEAYLRQTSILVPLPPALYRPLPLWVKRTVLLDLPMFQFSERDGQQALEEERRKKRSEEEEA